MAKQLCKIIDAKGNVQLFAAGINENASHLESAALAASIQDNFSADFISKHSFDIKSSHPSKELNKIFIGWGLTAYKFDAYKKDSKPFPVLNNHKKADMKEVKATIDATSLLKNLINTPPRSLLTLNGVRQKTLRLLLLVKASFMILAALI